MSAHACPSQTNCKHQKCRPSSEMRKRSNNREELPEASHPFARWGAGVAVSLWALSVQSLSDPWSKIGAILSPGVGYVVGLVLDLVVSRISQRTLRKNQQRELSENKRKIDDLYRERQYAIEFGAVPEIIASIDSAIFQFQLTRVDMIAPPAKGRSK